MIIIPAIDILNGEAVRLSQGEYNTAQVVADSVTATALSFEQAGAQYLHIVDLDGAKAARPVNDGLIFELTKTIKTPIEVGGGIRTLETVERYLGGGVSRVILGSAALRSPELVKQAVAAFGGAIAVGIDSREGYVSAEGWTDTSRVDYLTMAKVMADIGVKNIIHTDISRDGMLCGPSFDQLQALKEAIPGVDITASGGIRDQGDIAGLCRMGIYGAICGKSLYHGTLELKSAIALTERMRKYGEIPGLFIKTELIPAIIQQSGTKEVLMLAYMSRESLEKTLETGTTWFYSRSRKKLWNKGETSGHFQRVRAIHYDCDADTLLVEVDQTGPACHTGSQSCFYNRLV